MADEQSRTGRWWVPLFAFSCLGFLIVFALYVWPTPYQYILRENMGDGKPIVTQLNRGTGEVCYFVFLQEYEGRNLWRNQILNGVGCVSPVQKNGRVWKEWTKARK